MLGPSHLALFALLAVVGLLRVAELVVSRSFARRAQQERAERPRHEPIFVVMVVLHTLPFVLVPLEVLALDRPMVPWLALSSSVALVLAALLRAWTLTTLGAAWNVRIVKPARVVTAGPYRFLRHPNYLVVIVELLALPLFHGAFVTAALLTALNALVLARRIPAEERVLSTVPGYDEAMAHKPRFLPLGFAASRRERA